MMMVFSILLVVPLGTGQWILEVMLTLALQALLREEVNGHPHG